MNAKEIRQTFLDFFASKQHKIVPSAPMVVKDDPTLMFTNAGMNQFKDLFLGNAPIVDARVADSQKCLRVSGKHNDLEEVGHDTYHHTMFEMLGNWSFGDYFKQEAIDWAWELLVDVFKLPEDRLYATIFEGDSKEKLDRDTEAFDFWKKHLPEDRILNGNKKDNFWEMGDTGPCGPCSEIHIDLRDDNERAKISGAELVNQDDPLVIEVWNLVFIQYNRKADSSLEPLPKKHVDTGMGFERLCMAIQGKKSNYETDVFTPLINKTAEVTGVKYEADSKIGIAIRVISDHVRTIAFSIADGQLPSNNKAGYVIRRILRRAVRYGYAFLDQEGPFLYKLLPTLVEVMGDAYPELKAQQGLIENVIREEETAFLRTISNGIQKLDDLMAEAKASNTTEITGRDAFVLYDTYGFPLDLTELILRENGYGVPEGAFEKEMEAQKNRSRDAAVKESGDWETLIEQDATEFVGYDHTTAQVQIARYRKVKEKNKEVYQLVFNQTPFYGESGGQVGDTGFIETNGEKTYIIDTQKENNLPVHIVKKLPTDFSAEFTAVVDTNKRAATMANHSATHLLQEALQQIVGTHIEQKGSYVSDDRLRFDFSHFQKLTDEEIAKVEAYVNERIRKAIPLQEERSVSMEKAQEMGALMFFGEKYGDSVRVIKFNNSVELCGGTHVTNTANIGAFKIVSEGAIAAGIRRIEALTADNAQDFINSEMGTLKNMKLLLRNPKDPVKHIENILDENQKLQKEIEKLKKELAKGLSSELANEAKEINGINVIAKVLELDSPQDAKDLAYQLKQKVDNLLFVAGANINGKASLTIAVSDNLTKEKGLNASQIVREAAKEIQGGGGGQPVFATAGGKKPENIQLAVDKAVELATK